MTQPDTLHNNSDAPTAQATGFSRLLSPQRYPNNLPLPLTSFIGREREISAIKQRVWTTRLLTLTGPGGCGKTRLALRVAADLLDAFADGVWWIELASLANPTLIAQTVAATLGLREEAGRSILAALIDYLRSKQILLLLDNCEHLVEACAQLTESLLQTCPELYILATSREVLGIGGEVPYRVPPLATPHPNQLPAVEALAQYEAVKLFLDRAATTLPGFTMTDRNATAIAQVCYRLDGMPLAIELAAARVKMLQVDQIVARLDDRFRLLSGGSRTALLRHQTLRAAIDWSYDLLTEDERRVLRRLSVFAGGWTLEAAEVVCTDNVGADPRVGPMVDIQISSRADTQVSPDRVLDILTALVNKSLVIAERKQEKETRYRMLETIRQYAQDRLLESGEAEQSRTRHLDFFLAFTIAAAPKLLGPEQTTWFKRLDDEHDNLRMAMGWALESGRAQSGLRLGAALLWYWYGRGYWREGRERLERLLTRPEAAEHTLARAAALNVAGHYGFLLNDPEAAQTRLAESQAISLKLGEEGKSSLALSLYFLAAGMSYRNRALAQRALDESIVLACEIGDTRVPALGLDLRAHMAFHQGDYALARTSYNESLALWREKSDQWSAASAMIGLGVVLLNLGDYSTARSYSQEALAIFRAVGSKPETATVLESLGIIAQLQGDYQQAAAFFEESLALHRETGDKDGLTWTLIDVGILAGQLDDQARAAALLEALSLSQELGFASCIALCLVGLAGLQRQLSRAAQLLAAAQTAFEASHELVEPFYRVAQGRIENEARAALGEEVFASAWAKGRAMTLEQAIAYALAGADASSPNASAAPPSSLLQSAKARFGGLTRREREVAALVAQGKSNREIARSLVLSEYTIGTHVSNILSKLEFSSRTQIVGWAIDKGLTKR